jgi:alanine racemase
MDVVYPYRSYVLVSRSQIAQNYQAVRRVVGPAVEAAAVVKADAYGHGAVEVSRTLVAAGARWLAVSSADEGIALRRAGIEEPRILVMGGVLNYELGPAIEHRLTPVIHSLAQIADLNDAARGLGAPYAYHLKVDSGMGRLGTRAGASEIAAAVLANPHAHAEGLMTHFASAADYTSAQTDEQLRYFDALCGNLASDGVAPPIVHAASTIAIAYGRTQGWRQMVRTGHALYGYVSPARGEAPPAQLHVKPALTWRAKLLAVKEIPAGAPVGYGALFRAAHPMRIGIIGAGYADGVFHRLSNRGKVIAAGRATSILGAISMDLTTIDLSHTTALAAGDDVTLLGSEGDATLDAQQIARVAGTISYNILCSISARVKRVYV